MSAGGDILDAAGAGSGLPSSDDLRRRMRSKLPDGERRVLTRLDDLEDVYVDCGRDRVLENTFAQFMQFHLTEKRLRLKEAEVFFMIGPSGAGKSQAIERVLRAHPSLQPERRSFGVVRPRISISLSGYVHPRILAQMILDEAGARLGKIGRGDIWYRLPKELLRRNVSVVHIDEFSHLIRKRTRAEIEELADAIKGAWTSRIHPVIFVLSGLPNILSLPIKDEQVERRNWIVEFPDLQMESERLLVVKILNTMAKAVDMGVGTMAETDMPDRMAHVARYRFARICQIVTAAIQQALNIDPAVKELTRDHFALAYATRSLARGRNERNPFLVDEWRDLPPGSFLGDEKEEDEDER